jgi:hypothetical protein
VLLSHVCGTHLQAGLVALTKRKPSSTAGDFPGVSQAFDLSCGYRSIYRVDRSGESPSKNNARVKGTMCARADNPYHPKREIGGNGVILIGPPPWATKKTKKLFSKRLPRELG